MARSERQLRKRREERRKKEKRRKEQFMRAEMERENLRRKFSGDEATVSEGNSFARLERRRKSNRKLVREAIIRFFVCIAAFIAVCYFIAKLIADKI